MENMNQNQKVIYKQERKQLKNFNIKKSIGNKDKKNYKRSKNWKNKNMKISQKKSDQLNTKMSFYNLNFHNICKNTKN